MFHEDGHGSFAKALVWSNGTSVCAADVRAIHDASFLETTNCFQTGNDINFLDAGKTWFLNTDKTDKLTKIDN